jgi:hypothetical protein
MADESSRRINRLAKKARALDNMILKAAKMQKQIVEEIRRIGAEDKPARSQRMTKTPKARRSR